MADTPSAGTVTLAWASTLIDALVDSGLQTAVIAPGSRSTPLVLAAVDHEDLTTRSHLDERSAAYYALGLSKSTQHPTAVITTSGTATANLLPAAIEAHESRVPLVLLTADRPAELRDSGANQTIDQTGLYGEFVQWEQTIGDATLDPHRLRSLRATGARAIAEAQGPPAGAVHLNCPFRKPLEPPSMEARTHAHELAVGETPAVSRTTGRPDSTSLQSVVEQIETSTTGLIVVGPARLDEETATVVRSFGETVSYPILADPASGLRFQAGSEDIVLGGYDGYIDLVGEHLGVPETVLRIGAQPTSATLQSYLDIEDATQILIDTEPSWRDGDFRLDTILRGEPSVVLSELETALASRGSTDFLTRLQRIEDAYWDVVSDSLDDSYFEGAIAHAVADAAPADSLLFAGNSMPIRDLDRFGSPQQSGPMVHANRGASGIDGTISAALGGGDGANLPVIGFVGDLAAYHDMNGLLAVDRFDLETSLVVVNNDGGGIFHMLPIEDHDPPFEHYFKTPHGLDFEAAAEQYGLDYTAVSDRDDLSAALETLGSGQQLIECFVDARDSHRTRERLDTRVSETLEEHLTDR